MQPEQYISRNMQTGPTPLDFLLKLPRTEALLPKTGNLPDKQITSESPKLQMRVLSMRTAFSVMCYLNHSQHNLSIR